MNNTFYGRQAKEYYTKCQTIVNETCLSYTVSSSSHVAETNQIEYQSYTPIHIFPDQLSGNTLSKILDISIDSPHLQIDKETYYLYDMSDNSETEYNAILFSLNEPPKKSLESTKVIMDRYFKYKRVPYDLMQKIGKPFGYKSTLPYVIGEMCFVSDRGTSKKSASWHSLHLITYFDYNSKNKEVTLYSKQYPLLTLKMNKHSFDKQLSRAAHLHYIQYNVAINFLQNYGTLQLETKEGNILDQHIQYTAYHKPTFTAFDLIYYFVNYRCQEILTLLFEADNPYLEDIKERFKFPKFPS